MSGLRSSNSEERQGEIWSSRIQRELLALTTDDAEANDQTKAMLPSFVSVKAHRLDIANAECTVSFEVEINKGDGSNAKQVVVQLDVSLPKNADGSLKSGAPSYPFVAPNVSLVSGQVIFPDGSTIRDGDTISMDVEWTPSLHMADAIMNIGLKIKESILQSEPFHPAPKPEFVDPVDEVAKSARRIASSISQKASNFGKANFKAFTPQNRNSNNDKSPRKKKKQTRKPVPTTPKDVRIGDEINLLDEPWVGAHGVYACKAIRRPDFITDAMAIAEEQSDQQSFSSPTAMFRSFTKSARNVLQESFLMVTETHIIEMKSSKLNPTTGSVTFCIAIELMHKLKFRRQESVSLFFKPAPDDPLVYMCPDSSDVVHQIQAVLKRHGVKGKHTNAAAHRAIAEAMQLVQEIQTKELALKHDPSVNRVNEIMDLYRQAAERFAVAGDLRHEEVVTHMRKFLALPLTTSILDGSYKRPAGDVGAFSSPTKGAVPEGEIIEPTRCQLEDDHDIVDAPTPTPKKKEKERDKEFEQNMDNLLKEAEADLEKLKLEGSGTAETDTDDHSDSGLGEVAADLDEMMRKADAELAELMKS